MGTKNSPGAFDCYDKALPDEPRFGILARSPEFYDVVMEWVQKRREAITKGEKPSSDMRMVNEAARCAMAGREWRRANDGAWRK
jgi:hypothetical protein